MNHKEKETKNLFYINKKVDSFTNVERIHCIKCQSLKIKFKKSWEWIPYTKKDYNMTSNVECLSCGHKFMDDEWDD
jgi:C4-type Zn-finger protein|tara:strand:- start:438 stop:665 length:228 start_codon:yes stop_codon:yes gene_type:complete